MEILKVKFDNGFELNVDTIADMHNLNGGTKYITMNTGIQSADIALIEQKITIDSMKHITAYEDGALIHDFVNYIDNISIQKNISKYGIFLTVSAQKKV